LVVIDNGEPLVYIERGGKSLIAFPEASVRPGWAKALALTINQKRARLEIAKIDGEPAGESGLTDLLEGAGFTRGYKGWGYRP
jgi:ATP-dependent Lhr-like helicase